MSHQGTEMKQRVDEALERLLIMTVYYHPHDEKRQQVLNQLRAMLHDPTTIQVLLADPSSFKSLSEIFADEELKILLAYLQELASVDFPKVKQFIEVIIPTTISYTVVIAFIQTHYLDPDPRIREMVCCLMNAVAMWSCPGESAHYRELILSPTWELLFDESKDVRAMAWTVVLTLRTYEVISQYLQERFLSNNLAHTYAVLTKLITGQEHQLTKSVILPHEFVTYPASVIDLCYSLYDLTIFGDPNISSHIEYVCTRLPVS
jgi:hypothetical protein